ncbi:hypothetical protein PMIT1313_01894 [Prochlorococcus marinus str. MIT 1313]|nr:hypothetical protein PMIT1313_01894 [Prochlorococcus marinus str. MIT 1313]
MKSCKLKTIKDFGFQLTGRHLLLVYHGQREMISLQTIELSTGRQTELSITEFPHASVSPPFK